MLLYVVYAGSLLIDGIGLGTGLFPGGGSFAITFVPAIIAALLLAVAGAVARCPATSSGASRAGPRARARWRAGSRAPSTVPALAASGVRTAIGPDPPPRARACSARSAWWGFDICVLWAMFHAFGSPPPFTVIWMAYFVGTLGNLLPLPGGLGGVEGGMIGAFAAFGVDFNLAVLAVLSYRGDLLLAAHAPGRRGLLPAAPHGRALARRAGRAARGGRAPARVGAAGAARTGDTGQSGAILYK